MMTEIGPPYDGRRNITKGQKAMGHLGPIWAASMWRPRPGKESAFKRPVDTLARVTAYSGLVGFCVVWGAWSLP